VLCLRHLGFGIFFVYEVVQPIVFNFLCINRVELLTIVKQVILIHSKHTKHTKYLLCTKIPCVIRNIKSRYYL
jgi:hypothetical protein